MFIFSITAFSTAKDTQNNLLTFAGLVVVEQLLVISFKITQGTLHNRPAEHGEAKYVDFH